MAASLGIVHVHSNYSHDGKDSLVSLVEFAAARGIGFVGLTDHAEDFTEARWRAYVAECAAVSTGAVRLIPGLEFRFAGYRGLHLLAFGLSRWIEPTTPDEFIALASPASRFTAIAHPILAGYDIPARVREGVDGVEVWNGTYNTRYLPDPRSFRLLHEMQRQRPGIVGFAGLDQHDARNDRETRVMVNESEPADPLGALKAGHFRNRGRTMQFDGGAGVAGARLVLLSIVRWCYDRVERVQDFMVRALRSRRDGA
ncbi:MAG: PHP domain-containing protein [Gemmatimonadaceae bacterium]